MINCIAIDDEPLALNVIKSFCADVSYINLIDVCTNAIDAVQLISNNKTDLIFLDIHMPHISGLQFVKTLANPPLVIFTTAYSEYAIEGFELNAIDYLLKPIPFERFLKAVNKAHELIILKNSKQNQPVAGLSDYLMIKVDYSTLKVDLSEIRYIEGVKDYVKIVLKDKSLLTKSTMKNIEEKLPPDIFMRIHKSYIVSIPNIEKIENNRIVFGETRIPIGEHYKEVLNQLIDRFRL